MRLMTGVCIALMVLGTITGWILLGDYSGGAVGLFFTGCIAVPLDFLSRTSWTTRHTRTAGNHAVQAISSPSSIAPSNLQKPPVTV